ncbi:hypothetical protein R3P38DRAFT_3125584 [Favolaschia claudopus]|uniref:GATA-type domain-containing protein n=1 Tax=Favolaschia claudopus TaxID=2862362 RepID=A0AAV9ZAZ0_9AGAR
MTSSRLPSSTVGGSLSERDRGAVASTSTASNDEPQSVGIADVKYNLGDAQARRGPLSSLALSLPSGLSSTQNDADAAIDVRIVEAAHCFARSGGAEVHASEMLYLMQRRIPFPRLRELLELSASGCREAGVHTSSVGVYNGGPAASMQQSLFWVEASSSLPDLEETEFAALAREFFVVDAEPSADSHSRPEHDDHLVNTTPPWYLATTSGSTDHRYPQASGSHLYPSTSGLPVVPRHGEYEQSRAPGMTPEFRNGFGASSRAFYFGGGLPVGPAPSRILATTAPPFLQSPLPPASSLDSASHRAPSPATPKNRRRHHAPGKLTRKPGRCTNPGCDVTESTEWRTHPQTKAPLCNSCGQKIRAAFNKSRK